METQKSRAGRVVYPQIGLYRTGDVFFPKEQMLARIDKIVNMKEDLSLDELADMFSPVPADLSINKNELVKRNIVSKISANYVETYFGDSDMYTFEQTLSLYILDHCLHTGEMNLDEGKYMLQTFMDYYKKKIEGKNYDLMMIRKMGVAAFFCSFRRAAKFILTVT